MMGPVEIPPDLWPDVRRGKDGQVTSLLATAENLELVLNAYGLTVMYNQITKMVEIRGIDIIGDGRGDGEMDAAIEHVCNLAARHQLPTKAIPGQLGMLALRKQTNPVTTWLKGLKHDGFKHIQQVADLVSTRQKEARDIAFRRFFIQACAAADGGELTPNKQAIPKYEYVLVLRSRQGIQKTMFFIEMVPKAVATYVRESAFLDPSQKDSVEAAIGSWLVELGELDATFRKGDLSRLKAFLSDRSDTFRKSYGRTHNRYRRRTVFCGSVNDKVFLRDTTGNRRYWAIEASEIARIPESDVCIEQAWAEAWQAYTTGEQWWPTADEEKILQRARLDFEELEAHPIAEKLRDMFDLSVLSKQVGAVRMSASEIAKAIGIDSPDRQSIQLIVAWLERNNLDKYGQPDVVTHNGTRRWVMPANRRQPQASSDDAARHSY